MDKDLLERMRVRDFLSKENNYIADKDTESVLICGKHYEKCPAVTIIMPTYKRGPLLARAIKSILNQRNYDNYQLIIVDNEDVFDTETQTEKIIKGFNSDKILYYKNKENIGMYGNWNRCMELARSEWVCMVHDDDVLVENHLVTMMGILKDHPEIDFLSCDHLYLDERKQKLDNIEDMIKQVDTKGAQVIQYRYFDFNSDFNALYLGAVYRKECAIDIGGFQPRSTLLEDYIFVSKMSYYHNVYACDCKLYGYYWGQNESLNLKIWMDQSVWQYMLTKYISEKRNVLVRGLFSRRSKYMVIDLANRHNNGESFLDARCDIDMNELAKYCGYGSPKYCTILKKANSAIVNMIESIRNINRKRFSI